MLSNDSSSQFFLQTSLRTSPYTIQMSRRWTFFVFVALLSTKTKPSKVKKKKKQNSKMVTLEAYGAIFLSVCSPHEQSVPIWHTDNCRFRDEEERILRMNRQFFSGFSNCSYLKYLQELFADPTGMPLQSWCRLLFTHIEIIDVHWSSRSNRESRSLASNMWKDVLCFCRGQHKTGLR